MRIPSSYILCMMAFVSTTRAGGNPEYDPHWTVGDSWTVRYTLRLSSNRAGPPEPDSFEDFTYAYQVVSNDLENGRNVVRIRADCEALGAHWIISVDRQAMALVQIERVIKGVAKDKRTNPFTNDAWMPHFREFHPPVIHDFPKIPPTNANETRAIKAGNGTPFTQSIVFAPGETTANLFRTDPGKSVEHRTTIVWKAGQKWWSSAVTTLGGEVQMSGVLETVPPAKQNENRKVQDISSNGR